MIKGFMSCCLVTGPLFLLRLPRVNSSLRKSSSVFVLSPCFEGLNFLFVSRRTIKEVSVPNRLTSDKGALASDGIRNKPNFNANLHNTISHRHYSPPLYELTKIM